MTTAATNTAAPSLKEKAIRGSLWTLGGHFGQQAVRFGGNLILTRLLLPEAFGIMAVVQAVIMGINMFTDVGLGPGVIQSKRGDDREFLDTAWTIQAIRGLGLWLCTCILAWPLAALYGEPQLRLFLPIVALSAVGSGFGSITLLTLRRNVDLRPVIIRDFVCAVSSLIVMITLAFIFRSVWALVVGSVFRSVMLTVLSYFIPDALRPRLRWNKEAVQELFRFGRWIFISTALTFVQQQGDKLILGKFLSLEMLGVYSIAAMWSRAALDMMQKLNGQVLFPVYSNLANNAATKRFRSRVMHARSLLFAIFLPSMCFLAIFGSVLIEFLYEGEFENGGWILQILSLGSVGTVISTSTAGVLLAVGDSMRYMIVQVSRSVFLLLGMLFGGLLAAHYAGNESAFLGVIIGIASARILDYPVVAWAVRRHGLWLPSLDFLGFAASAAVCLIGLYFTHQI